MDMEFKGDKLSVNLIDEGKGDVVVLLHGWGARAEIYRSIINQLTPHFRVIAPDLPGFGDTTEPSFAYDADDYADFVTELLVRLEITEASFIGHSHGGRTAIAAMLKRDGRVKIKSLVLIDSAGIKPKQGLYKKIRIRTYKALKGVLRLKPVKAVFPNALESLNKRFGSADYAAASEIMRQSLVKVVNTDFTDRLCEIDVPTLLIWGENDADTPLSDAKIMEKKIPDCGLVTGKGAGHFSFADDPLLVARVLKSFYNY